LPYNVPADYFDSLPSEVLSRTSKSEAKVIPLFRRTWMRAAAVVIVAGGLVLGGLTIGQKSSKEDLAISQPQVTKSVAEVKPAIKQEIKKVSTSDLEAFVESVPANSSAPKKKSSAPEETKELLKDVSVNEMENFLAVVPQPDDELAAIDQP